MNKDVKKLERDECEAYKQLTANAMKLAKMYSRQKAEFKAAYYECKEGQEYWENKTKELGSKYSELS